MPVDKTLIYSRLQGLRGPKPGDVGVSGDGACIVHSVQSAIRQTSPHGCGAISDTTHRQQLAGSDGEELSMLVQEIRVGQQFGRDVDEYLESGTSEVWYRPRPEASAGWQIWRNNYRGRKNQRPLVPDW